MDTIAPSSSFRLEGSITLDAESFLNGRVLEVYFRGGFMGRYDSKFETFVAYTQQLAEKAARAEVDEVECHLEAFGESLSRAQHTIYRMIHSMRPSVRRIAIYATDRQPECAEHLRMATLFVSGLQGQPGASMEVVKI